MEIFEFLDQKGVTYRVCSHHPTYTAQQMAAAEHVPGMDVAKSVLVKADGQFYLCVVPACCNVDFEAVGRELGASEVQLASEDDLARLCPDCEIGAEPPIGDMLGVETLLDDGLGEDGFIVCSAGTHDLAVRMNTSDFRSLTHPRRGSFSYHLH